MTTPKRPWRVQHPFKRRYPTYARRTKAVAVAEEVAWKLGFSVTVHNTRTHERIEVGR